MKKLSTILCTLALLFTGVGGVNSVSAAKLYATLGKLSEGPTSTWNTSTNTITWTGYSNNMVSNFDFAAGDYKQYTKIGVTVTSITNADYVRIQIRANGQEKTVIFSGTGTIEKSLTTDFGFTVADLESVEWIRMLGSTWGDSHTINADNPASAVISEVYLEAPTRSKVVDLSTMAASEDNATWVNSTSTFAWTGTYSNAITLPGLSGNLSAYTTVNYVTTAGTADHFRILIYYSNGVSQTTYQASVGTKSVTFAEMGVTTANLAYVSSIKISGASDVTGNMTLTSFSLEGPETSYIAVSTTYENPAGTTDLNNLTGTNTSWSFSYPSTVSNETIVCGNGDGSGESTHVTITDYDYLTFVVTSASADASTGLRIWVWDDTNSKVVTLYPHPEVDYATVDNWETKNMITSAGVYVVKVSDYKYLKGIKALQGWNGNAGTITISAAYASASAPTAFIPSGKYTLIGETTGTSELTAALADAAATYYDATSVVGTGIDLTPTGNPNALFKANSGVLSNASNVIVGSACEQLALTDGYPFKAPSDFTATAAPTYNRAFTANTTTTVCLPFALTAAEASSLGTFYELSSFDGGTLHFTSVDAPVANTPYLVVPTATALTMSENGKSIVVTPASLGVNNIANIEFIGTLDATTIPASDGDYSYFAYNNGGLVKITTKAATLPAFRGYFKVTTSAISGGSGASRLNISFDDETTGVKTINRESFAVDQYYDLQGRRVAQPTKGLYIVNGKKVVK